MKENGKRGGILFMVLSGLIVMVLLAGCLDDGGIGGAGTYCCRYEERHTGCGGTGWSGWEEASFSFNIDDYREGWTPEKVCDRFSGTDTRCDGSCCINVQYRNNKLSAGSCP